MVKNLGNNTINMKSKFKVSFEVEIEFDETEMTEQEAINEITSNMYFPCEDTDCVAIVQQTRIKEAAQNTMTVDGNELPVYGDGSNAYVVEVEETYVRSIVVMADSGEEANDIVPSLDIAMRPEDYLSDSFQWGEPMIVDTNKKNHTPMKGTIKSHFPKPGAKGTFIIIISPEDGSLDIYEEMNEVTDKSELPEVGKEVTLAPSWPTWKMKF